MADSYASLVEKVANALPEVKSRSINSLLVKVQNGLLSREALARDDSLAFALLNWLNDFQDKESREKITKALVLLYQMSQVEEGCRILSEMQARQFLDQLSKYLVRRFAEVKRLLEIIYLVNQNVTRVVGQSPEVDTEPAPVEVITVARELAEELAQEHKFQQFVQLPLFDLAECDQKTVNDLQVQLKYTDRNKLSHIIQRVSRAVSSLPVELFRARQQLLAELISLFDRHHYCCQLAPLFRKIVKKTFRAALLYKDNMSRTIGLATKTKSTSIVRSYPPSQPVYGLASPLVTTMSHVIMQLLNTLKHPLSLEWVKALRPDSQKYIGLVLALRDYQVSQNVKPQLIRVMSQVPQVAYKQHSCNQRMRKVFQKVVTAESLLACKHQVVCQFQPVLRLFSLNDLQLYKRKRGRKHSPDRDSLNSQSLCELLQNLQGYVQQVDQASGNQVLKLYLEVVVRSEGKQQEHGRAKTLMLQLMQRGQQVRTKFCQLLIDFLQNQKTIEGHSSSEVLFSALDEQLLMPLLAYLMQGKSLYLALQLTEVVLKYKGNEASFLSSLAFYLYLLQAEHPSVLKAKKLIPRVWHLAECDSDLSDLVQLFSKDGARARASYRNLTGLDQLARAAEFKQGPRLQPQQLAELVATIKNPNSDSQLRTRSCDLLIGHHLATKQPMSSLARYCSYQLKRAQSRIRGEESPVFVRYAFICKNQELPLTVLVRLLATEAVHIAMASLKKKVFLSPFVPKGVRLMRSDTRHSAYQCSEFDIQVQREPAKTKPKALQCFINDQSSVQQLQQYYKNNRLSPDLHPIDKVFCRTALRHISNFFARGAVDNPAICYLAMRLLKAGEEQFVASFSQFFINILIASFYELAYEAKDKLAVTFVIRLLNRTLKSANSFVLNKLKSRLGSKFVKALLQVMLAKEYLPCFYCLKLVHVKPDLFLQQHQLELFSAFLLASSLNTQGASLSGSDFNLVLFRLIDKSMGLQLVEGLGNELCGFISRQVESPFYQCRAMGWYLAGRIVVFRPALKALASVFELGWARLHSGENRSVWIALTRFCKLFIDWLPDAASPDSAEQTFADQQKQSWLTSVLSGSTGSKLLSLLSVESDAQVSTVLADLLGSIARRRSQTALALSQSQTLGFLIAQSIEQSDLALYSVVWQNLTNLLDLGAIKTEQLLSSTRTAESVAKGLHKCVNEKSVGAMGTGLRLLFTLVRQSPNFTVFSFNSLRQQFQQRWSDLLLLLTDALLLTSQQFNFLQLFAFVCREWKDPHFTLDQLPGLAQAIIDSLKQQFKKALQEYQQGKVQRAIYLAKRKRVIKVFALFLSVSNQIKLKFIQSDTLALIAKETFDQDRTSLKQGQRKPRRFQKTKQLYQLYEGLCTAVDSAFQGERKMGELTVFWQTFQKLTKIALAQSQLTADLVKLVETIVSCGWAGRVLGTKILEGKSSLLVDLAELICAGRGKDSTNKQLWDCLTGLLQLSQVRSCLLRGRQLQQLFKRIKNALEPKQPFNSFLKEALAFLEELSCFEELGRKYVCDRELLEGLLRFAETNYQKSSIIESVLPVFCNLAGGKDSRAMVAGSRPLFQVLLAVMKDGATKPRELAAKTLYNLAYKNFGVVKMLGKQQVGEVLEQGREGLEGQAGSACEQLLRGLGAKQV